MTIIIANSNPIHQRLEQNMVSKYHAKIITQPKDLTVQFLEKTQPKYIFFTHWSFMIPTEIYQNYECIVFHMTDLPYGRGGSPLQNLIVRGHTKTKMSAIKVAAELDAGDIYMKEDLSLLGTAEEIFLRSGKIMEHMIDQIIKLAPVPKKQDGEIVHFKRRKLSDGNISGLKELNEVFDYIRMLDAEGYPKAFLETDTLKIEFSRASLKKGKIIADVSITEK